ncbi:MAG TPA: PAS domain S-box protein [Phycisphaerae bacterium]|nr:PAS domain S-box protein [Phycisphaerae bacterium]
MAIQFRSTTLARRLILLMLLATIPAMFGGILVLYVNAAAYMKANAFGKLAATANTLADRVDTWSTDAADDLKALARNTDLSVMNAARQEQFVRHIASVYPQFTLIHTLDLCGRDIARSDHHAQMCYVDRQYFLQILNGAPFARELIIARTLGRPALAQAVPIVNADGELQGVLTTILDLSKLTEIFGAARYGSTGFSCLVDENGRAIASPNLYDASQFQDLTHLPPVKDILLHHQSHPSRYRDENGIWWLAHAVPLNNGWSVVSLQQESEVLYSVHAIFALALGVMLVTAAVITLLTALVARRITRPIARMTATAGLIACGDWSQRIPEDRSDELGTLARAFNTMVADLVTAHRSVSEKASQLAASERDYRTLFETTNEGIWLIDASEHFTLVNRALADMLGYTPEEIIGQHPFLFLHPDEIHRAHTILDQVKRQPDHQEFRVLHRDGSIRWVLISASPLFDPHGNLTAILGMQTDITQRRRAEQLQSGQNLVLQLLATGQPLEKILSELIFVIEEQLPGLHGAVYLLDPDREFLRFAAAPSLPPTFADLAAHHPVGPHAGASGAAAYHNRRVIIPDLHAAGLPPLFTNHARENNLRAVWSQPIHSSDNTLVGTFSVYAADVHNPGNDELLLIETAARLAGIAIERRYAEDARNELQHSTEQTLALLDTLQTHAPVGFAFIDRDLRFTRINDTLAAMNDLPATEHLGRSVAEIVPDLWPQVEPIFHRVLAGEPVLNIEIAGETPSRPGELRYWLENFYPVRIRGDDIAGIGVVVVEVTERKRAEAAARDHELAAHREAVRAMERVLGIVGHELRTPLAGMRAISEFLLTDIIPASAQHDELLRHLNIETIRMSETINDLLEATRLNSGHVKWRWSTVDLHAICQQAIDTVRPLVDTTRVQLLLHADIPEPTMNGDADAIRRLVINFLSNARKHTSAGHIAIHISLLTLNNQRWVYIDVEDTGSGIPRKTLDRLGEAFALNAGVVSPTQLEGTGLGLAICKGIAAAHGGHLAVSSTPGQGTRITARLRADLAQPTNPSHTHQHIHAATHPQHLRN